MTTYNDGQSGIYRMRRAYSEQQQAAREQADREAAEAARRRAEYQRDTEAAFLRQRLAEEEARRQREEEARSRRELNERIEHFMRRNDPRPTLTERGREVLDQLAALDAEEAELIERAKALGFTP